MEKIQHYGVHEFTKSGDRIDFHAEEIQVKGFTIVPDALDARQLDDARTKLEIVYQQQLHEFEDQSIFKKINDSDIARAILVYDDFFLHTVAANPIVISLVKKLLGEHFLIREQNGIINRSDSPNYQLKWHRDLLYQHFTSSKPIAISALFCLDDFIEKTGGTYILPASHKSVTFPSEDYIRENEQCVNAPVGSVIVFDSMLYHRAGHNTSASDRRGINNMYVHPFIKQAVSLPKMLKGKYSENPFLNMFLGYDSETDESVKLWRSRRLQRLNSK